MPDKIIECLKCRGDARLIAQDDEGIHYHCIACGASLLFDPKTLKTALRKEDDGQAQESP